MVFPMSIPTTPLFAAIVACVLGSSCTTSSEIRSSWWGEIRDDGTEAVVLGYQTSAPEYEPFIAIEIDPKWRSAPRERLEESAHWTIPGIAPTEARQSSSVATGIRSEEIFVAKESSTAEVARAHRHGRGGGSTYLVVTRDLGDRRRATLFGGDGWPMDWVRVAEFEWSPPAPKWGLSNQTKEMFSNYATAAGLSTICVR